MKKILQLEEVINSLGGILATMAIAQATNKKVQNYLYQDCVLNKSGGMYEHIIEIFGSNLNDTTLSPWGNLLYFPRMKIIYCPIPKNGTNSALLRLFRIENRDLYLFLRLVLRWNPLFCYGLITQIANFYTIPSLDFIKDESIKKIVFIRDPVDRFLSAIENKILEVTIGRRASGGVEPLIYQMLSDFERKTGIAITLSEFNLDLLIRIIANTPASELDPHFLPQSKFIPSFCGFNCYHVRDINVVFGGRQGKAFELNSSAKGEGKLNVDYTEFEQKMLVKPFAQWEKEEFQALKSLLQGGGKDSVIRCALEELYFDDFALMSNLAPTPQKILTKTEITPICSGD